MADLIRQFGFNVPELSNEFFLQKDRIIRMGIEPTRIEILTGITGCEFSDCYARRVDATLDGLPVTVISVEDLIKNKVSTGRLKDLNDAQKLS